MKLFLTIVWLFIFNSKVISQSDINKPQINLEVSCIPAFYFNTASFGISILKSNSEDLIEINSSILIVGPERIQLSTYYNHNFIIHSIETDHRYFHSIWTGVKRVNRDNNTEDSESLYNRLLFRFGYGFGLIVETQRKGNFKFEVDLGITINFKEKKLQPTYPFRLRLNQFELSEDSPLLPAFRLKIRYSIPFD